LFSFRPLSYQEKQKQISEEQRKKYEEQYGEYTHKLEEQKTEYQKEHPDRRNPEEKVRLYIVDNIDIFISPLR
jgi:hypothetical protein